MASVYALSLPTPSLGRVRLHFANHGELLRVQLRSKERGQIWPHPSLKLPSEETLAKWLEAILAGQAATFPAPWNNPGQTPFARRVYQVVAELAPGECLSYGQVAAAAGSPHAARAVGNLMGKNPLPLVIP